MENKMGQAIKLATAEFEKEFGQGKKLKDGDSFVTVFNDGVLVIGIENNTFKVQVFEGKPYRVDFDLDL